MTSATTGDEKKAMSFAVRPVHIVAVAAIALFLARILAPAPTVSFKRWKSEIAKALPSAVELPFKNDESRSFAFFFDPRKSHLIVCDFPWNQPSEPIGSGLSLNRASEAKAQVLGEPAMRLKFTQYSFPFTWTEWQDMGGFVIAIREGVTL